MRVFLNERIIELLVPISLARLITDERIIDTSGLAIAINSQVIPKLSWSNTTLNENDRIIIITATAGG
ncbi:MAG: sulfur carrier protein [Crocinitomix sp.]|jgi:sulfur carrier protein